MMDFYDEVLNLLFPLGLGIVAGAARVRPAGCAVDLSIRVAAWMFAVEGA